MNFEVLSAAFPRRSSVCLSLFPSERLEFEAGEGAAGEAGEEEEKEESGTGEDECCQDFAVLQQQ